MTGRRWSGAVGVAVIAGGVALTTTPVAAAAAPEFCAELGATWTGEYCHTTVESPRKAVRDIKMQIPAELVHDPLIGPAVRGYLSTLMTNWRTAADKMVADSFGEEHYQVFRRGPTLSVVFHETYHADGPDFNNAYRTFTFDTAQGRRLQLADITKPGMDPLTAIPPLAEPFIQQALDMAPPPHQPGTYPFTVDRWTPDKVYSGAYKAWALSGDELLLFMPDYPVARDAPLNFTPGLMQWSMDGGTVKARIPLAALSPVLRPEYGGA